MECFYCIKIIQDKFPHSRKVQFKDIRQYHPIISHSCQHVHIKRFQHQHIPQRKLILHISCTRTYQVWKFKHFLTSMPHPNHQTINSPHVLWTRSGHQYQNNKHALVDIHTFIIIPLFSLHTNLMNVNLFKDVQDCCHSCLH